MYLLDVAEAESKRQAELVHEGGLKGYVLNGDLSVEQSDVKTIFKSVYVLAQMRHQDALDDILHIIYGPSHTVAPPRSYII